MQEKILSFCWLVWRRSFCWLVWRRSFCWLVWRRRLFDFCWLVWKRSFCWLVWRRSFCWRVWRRRLFHFCWRVWRRILFHFCWLVWRRSFCWRVWRRRLFHFCWLVCGRRLFHFCWLVWRRRLFHFCWLVCRRRVTTTGHLTQSLSSMETFKWLSWTRPICLTGRLPSSGCAWYVLGMVTAKFNCWFLFFIIKAGFVNTSCGKRTSTLCWKKWTRECIAWESWDHLE